jgi:hypothetical protein
MWLQQSDWTDPLSSGEICHVIVWRQRILNRDRWLSYRIIVDGTELRLMNAGCCEFDLPSGKHQLEAYRGHDLLCNREFDCSSTPTEIVLCKAANSTILEAALLPSIEVTRPTYLINRISFLGRKPGVSQLYANLRSLVVLVIFTLFCLLGLIAGTYCIRIGVSGDHSAIIIGLIAIISSLIGLSIPLKGLWYLRAQWNYPLVLVEETVQG